MEMANTCANVENKETVDEWGRPKYGINIECSAVESIVCLKDSWDLKKMGFQWTTISICVVA